MCLAPTRSKSWLTRSASRCGGPLEDHVLEEVGDAGQLGRLVAAAGLDEEPGGDRMGLVVEFGDDLEPVGQGRLVKTHDDRSSIESGLAGGRFTLRRPRRRCQAAPAGSRLAAPARLAYGEADLVHDGFRGVAFLERVPRVVRNPSIPAARPDTGCGQPVAPRSTWSPGA